MNEVKEGTAKKETEEGWGWPRGSSKAHYFQGTRSLCMRWAYTGLIKEDNNPSKYRGPDDCAVCHRRLLKMKGKT